MNYSTLKTVLAEKRINIPTLAKVIGMSKTGLYLAIDHERLTVDVLEKIAKVLDVPESVFFDNTPSILNQSKIEDLENANYMLKDSLVDKIRLERLSALSLNEVLESYHELIDSLSPDLKTQLNKNETFLRFQRQLLEAISDIMFKSDMRGIDVMKGQRNGMLNPK